MGNMMRKFLRPLKRKVAYLITKDYVGRLLAWLYKDRLPGKFGLNINTSNPRITPQAKASIYWGIYEGAEMRFVNRYLPKDMDVIELGGSIGVISALIGRTINPDVDFTIVEADRKLIPSIEENVRANNAGARFSILHGAISYSGADEDGNVVFYDSAQNTGGNKYHSASGDARADTMSVPAITLSDVLERNDIKRFSLVSDIEGAEAEFLEYDKDSLEKCEFMIIELHRTRSAEREISIPMLLDRLTALGFNVVDSDGAAVYVLTRAT